MRIGIEAQRIFRLNKHGMDFVALEVIKQIQQLDTQNVYFIFVSPGEDKCLEESKNVHIIEVKSYSYPLWEQYALPKAVKRYNLDMLHCTSNTAPINCSVPLVLTLHDIIFLEPRQGSNKSTYQNLGRIYRRFVVPKILNKCRKIITVSKFEEKRIGDFLKLDSHKITSIYNGYNPYFAPINDISEVTSKYIKQQPYIFFLGNTDPKKNVPGTLKAYSLYLKESKHKLPLVIGDIKPDVLSNILKEEGIEDIVDNIIIPGYIKNTDLPYIYNGAKIFLYTSFRESFGIPLLEAMACGTPVITGKTSALPEIAGEGAILVDVTKPQLIADKMIELEENQTLYQAAREYGLERVKKYSWKETANNLISLYGDIYKNL